MDRWLTSERPPMRLVINRVHDRDTVRLETIPERERRMIEVLGDDAGAGDRELALHEIVKPDGRVELFQRHREIGPLHLAGEGRLELLASAAGTSTARGIEIPLVPGGEERREEWKALDVVPMRVGNQQVALQRALAGIQQGLPEAVGAGTAVQNDECAIGEPHLHA